MKDKIKFIRELAENMNLNKIDMLKYEESDFEIQITKKEKEKRTVIYGGTPSVQPSSPAPLNVREEVKEQVREKAPEVEEIAGTKIISPMVGTFYIAPSPTSPPFIKEGDTVAEGQTLCIVEAMKLMNEVKSSVAGKVKKILVKDGDPIKKGQELVVIG